MSKKNIQIKQQIFFHFAEIVEHFSQYTIAEHITHVMRPHTGSYEWTDEELLKKFEKYADELQNEVVEKEVEEY